MGGSLLAHGLVLQMLHVPPDLGPPDRPAAAEQSQVFAVPLGAKVAVLMPARAPAEPPYGTPAAKAAPLAGTATVGAAPQPTASGVPPTAPTPTGERATAITAGSSGGMPPVAAPPRHRPWSHHA